jgi:hypothetical protein
VPVTEGQAELARAAWRRFGKGLHRPRGFPERRRGEWPGLDYMSQLSAATRSSPSGSRSSTSDTKLRPPRHSMHRQVRAGGLRPPGTHWVMTGGRSPVQ